MKDINDITSCGDDDGCNQQLTQFETPTQIPRGAIVSDNSVHPYSNYLAYSSQYVYDTSIWTQEIGGLKYYKYGRTYDETPTVNNAVLEDKDVNVDENEKYILKKLKYYNGPGASNGFSAS